MAGGDGAGAGEWWLWRRYLFLAGKTEHWRFVSVVGVDRGMWHGVTIY